MILSNPSDNLAVNSDLADAVIPDFFDEIRIVELFLRRLHAEVIEYRQQDRRDNQPQQEIFCHVIQVGVLSDLPLVRIKARYRF